MHVFGTLTNILDRFSFALNLNYTVQKGLENILTKKKQLESSRYTLLAKP